MDIGDLTKKDPGNATGESFLVARKQKSPDV